MLPGKGLENLFSSGLILSRLEPLFKWKDPVHLKRTLYTLIAPPAHTAWLAEVDYNCFYSDLGEFVARVQTRAQADFSKGWETVGAEMERRKYSLDEWRELGLSAFGLCRPAIRRPGKRRLSRAGRVARPKAGLGILTSAERV